MDDDVIIRVGNPVSGSSSDSSAAVPGSGKGPAVPGISAPPGRAAVFDLGGWQSVRIQRSCEAFPNVFEITATERFPGDNIDLPVKPGDPCQVLVTRGYGRDVVVSGYVDSATPFLSAGQHGISIVGRGKGQDLVDCSQVWPTGQFNNMTVLAIAQGLCDTGLTGIKVIQQSGDNPVVPQLVALYTETPFELIERVARFAGLLVYEGGDGSLILSRVGTEKMATGIVEGKNLERASISYRMSDRFSEYRIRRLTFDNLRDAAVDPEGDIIKVIADTGVPRFRPKCIIAETPQGLGQDFAIARGEWEVSRRFGRSTQIRLTVDSWRDGAGNLWAPNTIIGLDIPTLKVGVAQQAASPWVIATVVFRRDERGTAADLIIMPAAAFELFPVPLTPILNTGPN